MGEEVSKDLASVSYAFRLGWPIAELRGRHQPDRYDKRDPLYTNKDGDEVGSWTFVLGERRHQILQRLAARPSSYLTPTVVAAIEKSLADWTALAADATRRIRAHVEGDLYREGLMWRDLVRGERHPQDLPLNDGATVLASGAGSTIWNTAISVLGALGITSAGLYARSKTDVTSLLSNRKKRLEMDLCPGAADKSAQEQLAANVAP